MSVTPAQLTATGPVTVSVEVKNTGKRAGAEVVQLYVHPVKSSVPQPPKQLRGFEIRRVFSVWEGLYTPKVLTW